MSRGFVLAAYVLLFSVQICFRYTTAHSVDLDQYSSTFTKATSHPAAATLFHGGTRRDTTHSILNKRYQPVDIIPARVIAFSLGYSSGAVRPTFFAKNEPVTTRTGQAALLRGPPVPVC